VTRIKLRYPTSIVTGTARYADIFGGQDLPGSIEFMAAYQAALAVKVPPPPSPRHVIAGSLAAIVAGYLRSAEFSNLSPTSQRSYRLALKPILVAHGHRLVRDLPKLAARHIIEEIGATRPGMANLTKSVMSKVVAYAIEIGVRNDNPFAGLKPYRLGTYHTWTDAEIDQTSAGGHSERVNVWHSRYCSIPVSVAATS
jgi:enterobacteria phage integrase